MPLLSYLRLKKGEDRRIRFGHPWVYSNEIDTVNTPLKSFSPGQEVTVIAHDKTILGSAYVNPHSLIACRLYSRAQETPLDEAFFINRIEAALALRDRLFTQPFYRLVFSEADGLPGLVIDRFGEHIVMQINTAGMEKHIDIIAGAIMKRLPTTKSILLRNDSQTREHEGLALYTKDIFGQTPSETVLVENDVSFHVPLLTGQKTGWFYDHRLNRARLKEYVTGKTVLDTFSYLGAWGIQAAVFGAAQVDCIEASATASQLIRRNTELNKTDDKVKVITDDAFDAMKALVQAKKTYDVIVLDPPAFVKRSKDRKEGLIAYRRINDLALKMLAENGILVSCSCSMHVSMDDLVEQLNRATQQTPYGIQILERGHQGPDHPVHPAIPETDYLKALFVRKITRG